MIIKNIKIFSQNVRKNNSVINTILKTQFAFDIVFIQEPLWLTIHSIPSTKSKEGEELVEVPNHPNWITFSRSFFKENDFLRVVTYINTKLSSLHFLLCKDIFNHQDISL